MNEAQLIRQQLALERRRIAAVARACATTIQKAPAPKPVPGSALAQFQQACIEYLDCLLGWFEERDRRLAQLAAGLGTEDPRCRAVKEILARAGGGSEALTRLGAARVSAGTWSEFEQFLAGPWSTRRDALEQLMASDSRPLDWRRIGGIDADSMLEERTHFARVAQLLPAGVSLDPPPPPVA
jgi:hypothetical protein